jgi:hypothetical protein
MRQEREDVTKEQKLTKMCRYKMKKPNETCKKNKGKRNGKEGGIKNK